MNESHSIRIAAELSISLNQVKSVQELLDQGATVPFIARYRKEKTGALDEVAVAHIRDRSEYLRTLESRREVILKSIEDQGKLTDELRTLIESAETASALEDLYFPYRPKRRTRASIAKEKGLEPLAQDIFRQEDGFDPLNNAIGYINSEKGIESAEEALAGARDIIAEWVSEDIRARQALRGMFVREGLLRSKAVKGKDDGGDKYRDYFDYEEAIDRMPGHRVLAMFRGENEGVLKLAIRPPEERALAQLQRLFVKRDNDASRQVAMAIDDSYGRLLAPSLETDIRRQLKERADVEALNIFALNLRENLMASPLGQKAVLAIDPGFRTGCKIACLDRQGKLMYHTTVYIEQSANRTVESAKCILDLVERFHIEAIAIGNGTAGRETENFIRSLHLPEGIPVVMVNESGASIYSASDAAREEFPDLDLTVRGAVSIGRRLMDPLAELVKIDPRSIGVGQYQHDVDQSKLKTTLDDVVISCVNQVGVEVNTASKQLLAYVSGLGPSLARSIVAYREKNGPFQSREELKKVPRLGSKAFEQSAGFIRIYNAANPLDSSAVHPESYHIVASMAVDFSCTVADLMKSAETRMKITPERYISDKAGLFTIKDIIEELARPGRDPREKFEIFSFAEGVSTINDVEPDMKLPGIITNVTRFGAFVDIGVHVNGLIHISELSDSYVKNPADVVKANQKVTVTVLSVDRERKRIALSLKNAH